MIAKKDKFTDRRTPPLTGSRDAVESSIDASKSQCNQSWESSGERSRVAPWVVEELKDRKRQR